MVEKTLILVYEHLPDGRVRRKVTYPDGTVYEGILVTTKDGDYVWVSSDQYSKGEYYPEQMSKEHAED